MAWKSSFRQNYRTKFSPTFRRWDLSRRGGRGGTWWRRWERLNAGERNGKLPLNLAQDATYQSHTIRLTGLWSLPKPTQGLNTYKKIFFTLFKYMFFLLLLLSPSIIFSLFSIKYRLPPFFSCDWKKIHSCYCKSIGTENQTIMYACILLQF